MSEPVSALQNIKSSAGIADIAEIGPNGMITLRGDLGSAAVQKAATAATGCKMPAQGAAQCKGDHGLLWMSPDELLVLCPYGEVAAQVAKMEAALAGEFAMAVDVSDARALFHVSGAHARDVLAKLAPVDLAPGRFEAPMFRRTRLAQTAAAFWMVDADTFAIVSFRSQAKYVFDLLCVAARPGSEVGAF